MVNITYSNFVRMPTSRLRFAVSCTVVESPGLTTVSIYGARRKAQIIADFVFVITFNFSLNTPCIYKELLPLLDAVAS